jgi:DivIVA domain-containing protein
MVDESFHLTPLDARRYDFGSALRGYDKARVDQFRDQVAEELERLTRVAQDFESKAKGFHEQLRAFRDRDKALNEALVSAQQLRSEIRDQADREAQLVLREAHAEGERILEDARAEIRRLQGELEALERTRRSYLAQLRALASQQLTEVEAAEQAGASHAARMSGAVQAAVDNAPVTPRASAPVVAPRVSTPAGLDAHLPPPPVPMPDEVPPAETRRSERDTRTPTWLDSSVPE